MRCPVGCVLRLYHSVSAGPDGRHRQQSNPAHQREMGGIRLPGFVAIDGRPAMSRMAFAIDAAWHRWPRQWHTCINSKQAEPVKCRHQPHLLVLGISEAGGKEGLGVPCLRESGDWVESRINLQVAIGGYALDRWMMLPVIYFETPSDIYL